jgi:uracil-DNA glycosylase family 4
MAPETGPEAEKFWTEAETLGRALAAALDYYQVLGLPGLPVQLPPLPRPAAGSGSPAPKAPTREAPAREAPAREATARWAGGARDLDSLAELTTNCRACPRGRNRAGTPAFGRGADRPLLALVGLEPGLYEGPEAALLAAILEKGLKLDRFYLTSILKCPPGPEENPAELAEALSACQAIALRELALLAPQVVLALGETPGRVLTGQPEAPLGLLRNRAFRLEDPPGAWLRVTFSLEQMLDLPDLKLEAWKNDFLKIKKVLDKLI